LLLGFALPALFFCLAIILGGGLAIALGVLAAASALAGLLVERWLIFAEATHTVALYYPTPR
jgi:DMSO reductase anchor subunit